MDETYTKVDVCLSLDQLLNISMTDYQMTSLHLQSMKEVSKKKAEKTRDAYKTASAHLQLMSCSDHRRVILRPMRGQLRIIITYQLNHEPILPD